MIIDDLTYTYQYDYIKKKFFINYEMIPKKFIYIYRIYNIKNGKSYIGKTHNLKNRISQYIFSYLNKDTSRNINKILIDDGILNFRMELIDTCDDNDTGIEKEKYYINKFDCIKNGYNMNSNSTYHKKSKRKGKYGHPHSDSTKRKKSKIIAAINIYTNEIIFSTGMKLLGDYLGGVGRDLISHAYNRCGKIYNFYIIAVNREDQNYQQKVILNLLNKKSNQSKLYKKCNEFNYAFKIIFDILSNEKINSDFSYKVITQEKNNDKSFKEIGMNIVYEYFKLSVGSDNS